MSPALTGGFFATEPPAKPQFFQQVVLRQLDIQWKKGKQNLVTDLILFSKINSKSIIDLNVKHKTVKLQEGYMGENFDDLEYEGDSLDKTPEEWSIKGSTDTLDFIQTKNIFAKDNVKRMRRQDTDWKKIFTKDTSVKSVIHNTQKLLKFNNKETTGIKNELKTLTDTPPKKVKVKSLSRVQFFATPWTVAHQAPQSMEFSRQEYWSGLPFPSPGYLPNPGIEPGSPTLQADALQSEPPGKQV